MKRGNLLLGAAIIILVLTSPAIFGREPLTFEQRVKAQEAIEKVYYNHRIWPKDNKTPKPAFEKMVSKETIEAKVTDYLKKSAALEKYWYRPITGEQLQAEMDRMAKGTKDPATLNELFEALNNDPYLIAECLARPVLADRLIRNWYANDERFHQETREKAEEALKHLTPDNFCSYPEGQYSKMTYRLKVEGREEMDILDPEDHSIGLSENEFAKMFQEIPEEGKISGVIKEDDCFVILHTVEKNEQEMTVEGITFKKISAEEWLKNQQERKALPETPAIKSMYLLPVMASVCYEGWDNGILDDVVDRVNYFSSVWTGSEVILWGGSTGDTYVDTGSIYNPSTDTWRPTSRGNNCPVPRDSHTAVWTGSEMIVWGGYNGTYLNSGGRLNPVTESWASISTGANAPSGRIYHTAIWTNSEMIVWGGYSDTTPYYKKDGGRYNPITNIWTAVSIGANCPSGRRSHTAVWTGSAMIIWGGYSETEPYSYQDGFKYYPDTDNWTAISTSVNCPSPRYLHSAVWTGTEMIVWGGTAGALPLDTGGKYDFSTNTWSITSVTTGVPTGRYRHNAIWTGDEMIIWGGRNSAYYFNTGSRYNPLSDSWVTTSSGSNVPPATLWNTAIWTGNEMIVNVGRGSSDSSLGAKYDPISDTWVPINTGAGVPSARDYHSTVWTGSEMIIWGGRENSSSSVLNTGAIYSPVSDSWLNMSISTGSPSARMYHTSLWTGTEMIVWGGKDGSGNCLNDGGRYYPSTDLWSPVSSAGNCPTGRYAHTSVWTGDAMVVWGGYDGQHYLNTGARYYTATDSWIATSIGANCPSNRIYNTAVWTGSEMIIWGGLSNSSAYLKTGGKYDPVEDRWLQTATSGNCPAGRYGHTAIWNGTSMIIWGGDNGPELNSGGQYDPLYDYWTSTSEGPNMPDPRAGHIAIWTGSEMVVWGGMDASNFLDSGGKLNNGSWSATIRGKSCPTGRYRPSGIWSGNCMIIWGGTNSGSLRTGGIYYTPTPPSDFSQNPIIDEEGCLDNNLVISWMPPGSWGTENGGTRGYDVLRDGTAIASGLSETTTSYMDSTGTNDVIYLYQVRATNGCGASTTTPGVYAADYSGVAPSGFTNNNAVDISGCTNSGIRIEWTAPTNWGGGTDAVRTFDVIRNESTLVSALPESTLVYTDTSCSPGTSYLYQVRANNGCGASTVTDGASAADGSGTVPAIASNNNATDISGCLDSGVLVSWAAPSEWGDAGTGTRSYDILRDGSAIDTGLNVSITTYTDTSSTNGTSYLYQVRAVNGCGLSSVTTGVSAADAVASSPAISNNSAADIGCLDNGVLIIWTVPSNWGDNGSGTRTFDILRDGSSVATGLSGTTLSYTDLTGVNGTAYLYQVRATNGCGLATTTTGTIAMDFVCTWNLLYQSHGTFTQITGDGDAYFEKGEKWSVPVTVTNAGNTPATNVTAQLSGNGITVCNSPASFGTISAGGTATVTIEFLISSSFTPCGGSINFNLGSKTCAELTPAGADETNLFSVQVGQIATGTPIDLVLQPSSADSYVNQASAGTNYGTGTMMSVQSRVSQAQRTLVMFDLSAIPEDSVINSATLELYASSAPTTGLTLNVHRITGTWTEAGVTWTNQPAYNSTVDASLAGGTTTGWKIWNIASLVQDWVDGTSVNYGLIVKGSVENDKTALTYAFASKENTTTGNRPILRINYTPPTTINCDYIGSGECEMILAECAPGNTYENGQAWSGMSQSWPALSGAAGYKLYRGVQNGLQYLLTADNDSCLRYEGITTSVDLSSDDPSGETGRLYWYIVTGTNGSEGPAGNGRIVNSSGNCE